MIRVIYAFVFLLSLFFLPWWAWLLAGLAGVIYFKNFYEFAFFAFVADSVYGTSGAGFFHISYFMLIIALGVVMFSEPLKRNVIFFSKNQNNV